MATRFDEQPDEMMDRQALLDQMGPRRAQPRAGSVTGASAPPMEAPAGTTPATPEATPSVFQSGNRSVSGYLQEAMGSKLGDIRQIGDEAGRKSAAEAFIRSLVPEIEARGGKVGDIRNEKLMLDGRWIDLVKDIEGVAEAQFIEPDSGGGARMPNGMMAPAGFSSSMQALAPTDMGTFNTLQQRLKEILGGDQAFDREALIAQMSR